MKKLEEFPYNIFVDHSYIFTQIIMTLNTHLIFLKSKIVVLTLSKCYFIIKSMYELLCFIKITIITIKNITNLNQLFFFSMIFFLYKY
jgi:hypothetical protein